MPNEIANCRLRSNTSSNMCLPKPAASSGARLPAIMQPEYVLAYTQRGSHLPVVLLKDYRPSRTLGNLFNNIEVTPTSVDEK
jgi:hypothetical protein